MSDAVEFSLDRATVTEIAAHLSRCDGDFVPPLSSRVEIGSYARKLGHRATRFEAWTEGALVGLLAAYFNDVTRRTAYITSVSVEKPLQRAGLAARLLAACTAQAARFGFESIELDADRDNVAAIALYTKSGFAVSSRRGRTVVMRLNIGRDVSSEEMCP
jgi:ribosomal protein S18 acetylase RimI-like enzyme